MLLTLNINHHGSSVAWIDCRVPDTGSAEIPVKLVDELIALGVTGFPTLTFTRRSIGSDDNELGCINFLASSEIALPVTVPGVTSCSSDEDCPEGETCLPELICG